MKRSLLFVLVSVMTACGIGVAHSKECQGVNFPEQVQLCAQRQRRRPQEGLGGGL